MSKNNMSDNLFSPVAVMENTKTNEHIRYTFVLDIIKYYSKFGKDLKNAKLYVFINNL